MKKYLIPVLVLVFSVASVYSQTTFSVPRGRTVRGFTFTRDGVLKYKGKEFSPPVKVIEQYEKFEISYLPEKGLAGAIANDGGENDFVLLDLRKAASIEVEGISAPNKMFWSPSRKFLVVYSEYESAGLSSINLATLKVRQNENWFPETDLWVLKNTPRWIGKSDVLAFKVVTGCDPTADPSNPCGGKKDKPIFYDVQVNAATLKIKSKRRIRW